MDYGRPSSAPQGRRHRRRPERRRRWALMKHWSMSVCLSSMSLCRPHSLSSFIPLFAHDDMSDPLLPFGPVTCNNLPQFHIVSPRLPRAAARCLARARMIGRSGKPRHSELIASASEHVHTHTHTVAANGKCPHKHYNLNNWWESGEVEGDFPIITQQSVISFSGSE